MDLSNIKPGMTIKNYKQLCLLLGEKPKSQGDLKFIHLMNIKRHLKLKEVEYTKYIVEEIYQYPLYNEIKKSDYLEEIGNIIIDKCLASHTNSICYIDKLQLIEELNKVYEYIPVTVILTLLDYSFRSLKSQCLLDYQLVSNGLDYKILLNVKSILKERKSLEILENNYSNYEFNHMSEDKIKGIYCIINTINNKKYIGRSTDINNRIRIHLNDLRNGCHHNYKLQADYILYGETVFKFILLEENNNIEDFPSMEHSWISHLGGLYDQSIYNISDPLKENAAINKEENS